MKTVTRTWTTLIGLGILCLATPSLLAEEKLSYVPMIGYEILSLDSQDVHSTSVGGAILAPNATFVGLYSYRFFDSEPAPDYPDYYHSLDLLYDALPGRHQVVGLLKTESDRPVYGGIKTFQTAGVYGYEVISRPQTTLALGGGVAVADFGLAWPVLPVPFIRLGHESRLLDASFDFITGPNLGLTLLPESHLQLRGDMRMDEFRDIRDLIFEVALEYRFFSEGTARDSFAGMSLGLKNDVLGFTAADSGDEYQMHYYGVFGEVDLGLLTLTGGYAFDGRKRYGEDVTAGTGEGFFLTVQGLCMFSRGNR
jgi:hypothetical protein